MATPPLPHPLHATGHRGSVTFDGRFVMVRHTAFAPGGRAEKQFAIPQISGVELKKTAGLRHGTFTVVVAGAVAPRAAFTARRFDPLTVEFTRRQMADFERMRDVVLHAVHQHHATPPPMMYAPPPQTRSLVDELTRLAALRNQGVISPAEFEAAKRQILGGSPM